MTGRRLNISPRKSPALTGGDERPTPACQGNPWPYDILHDQTNGPDFHLAVKQAREICGYGVTPDGAVFPRDTGCPLRETCVATSDDQWARAVRGEDLSRPTQQRDRCGTPYGYKLHKANREHACDACTHANRKHSRDHAAKKRGAAA